MQAAMPESLAEGRFRLLEVIGEGGMATVYRAFDLRLQRPRAIKVLSPQLASRPALRKRFLSEAQTMANLEESRVVRIFDTGEDGDLVYIVMELVDGGSLLDRVRDYGPLPPRMAAEATVQICESLQAAHDAGVIHRDIKPHNILLTKAGEVRVTDFGIAQVQSDTGDGMTKTGAVMGTWGFMAPEQKSNAKTVDARADLYSVGATMWSLLTAESPPELFMADNEPSMLQGLPEELAEVIKRATRYRREDRYVSARAMADSIRALVSLLPEDPELTVPLVPPTLEKRVKPLDTMQQFASEMLTGAEPAQATMVPNLAEEAQTVAVQPAPAAAASPVGPVPIHGASVPAPITNSGSFAREPAPATRSGNGPWIAAAIAVVGLFAVVAVAALIAVPLLVRDPVPVPGADASASATLAAPAAPVAAPPGDAVAAANPSTPPVAPATTTGSSSTGVVATPPKPGDKPRADKPAAPPTPDAPVEAAPVPAAAPTPEPPVAVVADATSDTSAARSALAHTPPAPAGVGGSLAFAATVPGGGWTVKLYYRPAAGGTFQEKKMLASGDTYTATVKVTDDLAGGVAYFISAEKGSTKLKEGSATSPRKIAAAQ